MVRRLVFAVVFLLALLPALYGCSEREPLERTEATRAEATRPEEPVEVELVISGGTLIDGTGSPPVRDAVVALDDGRVVAAGRAAEVGDYRGAKTFDAGGMTVMPGFVNAHAHSRYVSIRETEGWTRAGITTVRDLAGPVQELVARREAGREDPALPELIVSGPMLTVQGGHPFPIYGEEYPALAVSGPEDAAREVNRLLDTGADGVKIVVSGRTDTGWPELSDAEIRAITDAAHARGAWVSAHVDTASGLRRAVENGVDDAAHSPRDRIPEDLISLMVERDVALVPTIDVYENIAEENGTTAQWNAETRPVMYDNLRRFEAAGGTLALGDDFGNPGVELGMMTDEIEHWLAAGLPPLRVLSAATEGGASVAGIEGRTGTLEPGKEADVLVVDGDPLAEIDALRRVSLVVQNGVRYGEG